MSTGRPDPQVKKVVKKIVIDVVRNEESVNNEQAELLQQDDIRFGRRPSRARKEPDRFAVNAAATRQPRKPKEEPEPVPEVVMEPPPADLKGILKPGRVWPTLSAAAGNAIAKKYRKVRVARLLRHKIIPPLPGWRPDRSRMPEDEPDEEEQKRRDAANEAAAEEEKEAQKRRRKRKSIGIQQTSDADTIGDEEESGQSDGLRTPRSPDVFFESYMKEGSPDSVLTSDSEENVKRDELSKARATARFIFPQPDEQPTTSASKVTVAAAVGEDTVVAESSIDTKKRTDRRRSIRMQTPVEEEATTSAAAAKKDRRQSKVFPVTPAKDSPKPPPPQEKAERASGEKKGKRKSGVVRNVSVPKQKKAVVEPANDPEERDARGCADADRQDIGHIVKTRADNKVTAWLSRACEAVGAAGDSAALRCNTPDVVETPRSTDPHEVVEVAAPVQPQAAVTTVPKGRRSMRTVPPPKEVGKENKEPGSKSKSKSGSSSSSSKSGSETKKKLHPFFSQMAPKPSSVAVVSTVSAEKKQSETATTRRRSMFVPKVTASKKSLAAKKKGSPPTAKKKEEDEADEEDDEDVIEVVAEVKKEEKEKETPQPVAHSTWRSSEIDAAPYAGLMHVGREKAEEDEGEGEGEGEGVLEKRERLSVLVPVLSSYAIPASLRNDDPEEEETVPVFDEERHDPPTSAAVARRAHNLAAAGTDPLVPWPDSIRPRKVEECVGDREVLERGRRWLQKWKARLDKACAEEKSPKAPKAKRKKRRDYSDSEPEDSDSDYELREDESRLPNPLVLSGPIGCGKTAYVRALSSSVGFSLLESAPDERRAGANLRARLAEAVKSHRMSSKPAGGIASFFSPKANGEKSDKEKEKKSGGEHTLVAIEHIDVVFAEEDRLFWPALAEILATARIPIVLICNVVPDELTAILRQTEEEGAEPLELSMERPAGRTVEEYVEASLTGTLGRALEATVVPRIAARARQDLRAALLDAHWAAAGTELRWDELADASARRVDDPAVCDRAAPAGSLVWTDECARRAEVASANAELRAAAAWPARGRGMRTEVYGRLCAECDENDGDASRAATGRAERAMEMARSGLFAGGSGRAGLMTRHEIALDWMPALEQMDAREQETRKTAGRRHQHYFNVVRDLNSGSSIDPLDRLQGACAFFRLPSSQTPVNNELQ